MNDQIDVWKISPSLNTGDDYVVHDSPERVIEYVRELVEEALCILGHGDVMTIKITHTTMSRRDYEECRGD